MKKILMYSFLTAGLVGVLSVGVVSAQGWFGDRGNSNLSPEEVAQRQEVMFQQKADFLGISVDEVKEAWADGKRFKELAEEQGITLEELKAQMGEARQERMEAHIQAMVDNGVITQEQADQKSEYMQERSENGYMGKGFHRGSGECFAK